MIFNLVLKAIKLETMKMQIPWEQVYLWMANINVNWILLKDKFKPVLRSFIADISCTMIIFNFQGVQLFVKLKK